MDSEIKASIESECVGRCPEFKYGENSNGKRIHDFDLIPVKDGDGEKCWEIDRRKILFSMAFWRLQSKTQIYIATIGDHYSDRMTHTLIVNEIARKISKRLNLNDSLTEAISLGHDMGHTPFGHEGEARLNELMNTTRKDGFSHNIQGARVATYIEYDKVWKDDIVGMGLTWEVISGIICHTQKDKKKFPDQWVCNANLDFQETPESKVVFFADEIAQRVLDIDDALRANIIERKDLEEVWNTICEKKLPKNFKSELIEKYTNDIVENDLLHNHSFKDLYKLNYKLKKLIDNKVHGSDEVKIMDERGSHIIKRLFEYYIDDNNWEKLPGTIRENVDFFELSRERVLTNYIASMTDSYAEIEYYRLFK